MLDRLNLEDEPWALVCAHHGDGLILFRRLAERPDLAGAVNFIDVAEIPPGGSIGRHTHANTEEELYLVLTGTGHMWRDGAEFAVRAGDLVRNAPGGSHGLTNTGSTPLRIFVIELAVTL